VFRLLPYSDKLANGTIKIKTIQNGNIQSSNVDYTGLSWVQQLRIKGKLFNKTPEFISDNYLDGVREISQIQDQVINSYTLESSILPSYIVYMFLYDLFLLTRIFVTDYNLINEDVINCEKTYNNIELYPDEYNEPSGFSKRLSRLYSFQFVDKAQRIIKRNF